MSAKNLRMQTTFPDTSNYPELLQPLDDHPTRLFFRGVPIQKHERCIAVIGTRKMTPYGRSAVQHFVQDLVLANGFILK
jgi:predicted Rossmann fold nucleotide-binding protein DprA/Smf involved in DNA uptake